MPLHGYVSAYVIGWRRGVAVLH